MAIAGKVAITPKGNWSASTAYQKLDLVFYENASYVALQPSTGVTPTNTAYWMLCVQSAGSAGFDGIINGEIQVGNAKTLDGHGVGYFASDESVSQLSDDLNVERERINTLVSLPEGSTTADAELLDIRVGADGKTYTNAGEAVRTQITDLKSDLSESYSELKDTIGNCFVMKTNLLDIPMRNGIIQNDDTFLANTQRGTTTANLIVGIDKEIILLNNDYKFAVYYWQGGVGATFEGSHVWQTKGWQTENVGVFNVIEITETGTTVKNNNCCIRITLQKVSGENFDFSTVNLKDILEISDIKKLPKENIDKRLYSPKFAHLSFDDVRYCMEDITANSGTYNSIFDNPFFAMLKDLHDTYGTMVSLYLFTTEIANWTNKFAREFTANSDWLKFGFHLKGYSGNYAETTAEKALADYNEFVSEIVRITGSVDCIDRCPRISNFAGNLESMLAMRDANGGIVGLLSAYDDRNSYYLDSDTSAYLFKHGRYVDNENHLTFYRSIMSMEAQYPENTLPRLLTAEGMNGAEYLILMMHEYGVYGSNFSLVSTMSEKLEYACNFAIFYNYDWDYPMNRILK